MTPAFPVGDGDDILTTSKSLMFEVKREMKPTGEQNFAVGLPEDKK
jgi:hypothetical protein